MEPVTDPSAAAKTAGLTYVRDKDPGIKRIRSGRGCRYVGPNGAPIRDRHQLSRIKALVIPPAWKDVWICTLAHGHLQATGCDKKGRKQYRYHTRWREVRDQTKFHRMIAFAKTLPTLRKRIDRDLKRPGLPQEKIVATLIRLLELSLIRIGNEEYARDNHTFGLTTMRDRHVDVSGSSLRFEFRGKRGVQQAVNISDRRLAKIVRRCQDLSGQELFQYVTQSGERRTLGSEDVNEYLRRITGQDFTAKDFRTWAATVLTLCALQEGVPFSSQTQGKRNVVRAIKIVAGRLGNTVAVCRKCYVHPAIVEAYLSGSLGPIGKIRIRDRKTRARGNLTRDEAAVVALLLKRAKKKR